MNPSPDFPDETGNAARGGTNGGKFGKAFDNYACIYYDFA
jgi:hypothetical protein